METWMQGLRRRLRLTERKGWSIPWRIPVAPALVAWRLRTELRAGGMK